MALQTNSKCGCQNYFCCFMCVLVGLTTVDKLVFFYIDFLLYIIIHIPTRTHTSSLADSPRSGRQLLQVTNIGPSGSLNNEYKHTIRNCFDAYQSQEKNVYIVKPTRHHLLLLTNTIIDSIKSGQR